MFLHNTLIHWINRNNLVVLQNDWGNKENKTKNETPISMENYNMKLRRKKENRSKWILDLMPSSSLTNGIQLKNYSIFFFTSVAIKLENYVAICSCLNATVFHFDLFPQKSNKKFVSIVLWAQTINSLWMRVFCPFQMLN